VFIRNLKNAEEMINIENVVYTMAGTQIPVNESARSSLRMYKVLSGATTYSEAIIELMAEAGYEAPEGEVTDEELIDRVFNRE
jgi:hypothetical protein